MIGCSCAARGFRMPTRGPSARVVGMPLLLGSRYGLLGASNSLIWAADGRSFPGYPVTGNFIAEGFQVRFGTKNGEHRAYFTETSSATICNIAVDNGQLSITATPATVPHS
jgi:hypothetical protein